MTDNNSDSIGALIELAESWEAKAKNARKIECAPEYQAYWRGYAEAFQEASEVLCGRVLAVETKSEGSQ